MSRRTIGIVFLILGLLAAAGEVFQIDFPTARWFFNVSREVPVLGIGQDTQVVDVNVGEKGVEVVKSEGEVGMKKEEETKRFLWFGWLSSVLMTGGGGWLVFRSFTSGAPDPVTLRRIKRFKEIKRGYYSFLILVGLAFLAALDQVVVGDEALAVRYKGEWSFPAFSQKQFKGSDFGIEGEMADVTVKDYRKLKKKLKGEKAVSQGRVIMPLIPYAPTNDTLGPRSRGMVLIQGKYYEAESRSPYYGLAATYHDLEGGKFHLRYTLRNGVFSGAVDGWDEAGDRVYSAEYVDGEKMKENYTGKGDLDKFLGIKSGELRAVKYHPAPPIWEEKNWLGTTSQGLDVVAYLYGGLQVNFKAAMIFLPIVYLVGITVGMLMGYLGGLFDLIMDRLIEVFSNVPFLFVVIIFSSFVPEKFKGLPVILTILIVFGWMGIAALMRTAAYRDKERDYIAAARVLGAGTPRIIFRHLLPNTIAIIVTLVPFTMSGLVSSLTGLDYLGFGLPARYATWGRLLNDGLANLSAPWLVSSTFFVLVGLLVLITFIGEAVREAFDPKKYSYYR
jgi:microcin C transport system permease protein